MRPISELSGDEARSLSGVLFDLDDTVLTKGALSEAAYGAIHELYRAGLLLVVVTGRSAALARSLVAQWPVHGAVAENGALDIVAETLGGNQRGRLVDPASSERAARREALLRLVRALGERFPALQPADDAGQRLSDFTFDIGEFERVEPQVIDEATRFARAQGADVSRSSIHLHVSFDRADKASGVLRFMGREHGLDPTLARQRLAYVGDSANDAACFAAFRTSIAVANLSGRPTLLPRFVTRAPMGEGFAEASRALLSARR